MSKKIDERLPQDFALKFWPGYAAVKSPWDKLMNFKDLTHFIVRADSVLGAVVMQAFRIVCPDYEKRSLLMCETFETVFQQMFIGAKTPEGGDLLADDMNAHPFCCGSFFAALEADMGDERNLMCGRVNDFGSYRVEKELDICDWDIVGSDLCRSTIYALEGGMGNVAEKLHPNGPHLEFNMVEAKGCGDRHCRVVAECRKKWPMPPKQKWEHFGPIATDDMIKYTPEEECIKDPQFFRQECSYTWANGANKEIDASVAVVTLRMPVACMNLLPASRPVSSVECSRKPILITRSTASVRRQARRPSAISSPKKVCAAGWASPGPSARTDVCWAATSRCTSRDVQWSMRSRLSTRRRSSTSWTGPPWPPVLRNMWTR